MSRISPRKWLLPFPLIVAAILSGALLALGFPPMSLGLLSFVALVPVVFALHRRPYSKGEYYRAGYLFGVAFFLGHLWWIVRLIPASSITMPWLMIPALLLLVAYLSVYPGLFFLILKVLGRRSAPAMIFIAPGMWALIEKFRSSSELGFPWGAIGYSLVDLPLMMQGASVVGLFGLGAVVVAVNALWAAAALSSRRGARLGYFAAGSAALALIALHGYSSIRGFATSAEENGARVAVVQPNVDLAVKWKPEFTDSTFRLIERLHRHAAELGADVAFFPETCAPVYLRHNKPYRDRLSAVVEETGTELFIGFLDGRYDGPGGELNVYNSSGIFRPGGTLRQYDKMHLLPFGEAMPFAWKFRGLRKIDFGQANFQPGSRTEPVPSAAGALGPLICFEAIFPDISRRFTAAGADILVNITNDGWFGDTPGPYQHGDMAILRAVENRRYLVRSANSGVSMVVDPVGRVVARLDLDREGLLVENVTRPDVMSPYTRLGDMPVVLGAILLVILGAIVARVAPPRR